MRSAVKIALAVTEGQSTILDGQSKIANWLYNRLLENANGSRFSTMSHTRATYSPAEPSPSH